MYLFVFLERFFFFLCNFIWLLRCRCTLKKKSFLVDDGLSYVVMIWCSGDCISNFESIIVWGLVFTSTSEPTSNQQGGHLSV
jgi:hypothetical protein